jgi:hypothetical protein
MGRVMIIVKIIGGLGNQMFQYAIGRKIAYFNKDILKLDITAYNSYTLHKYGLHHFNIIENIATDEDLRSFKKSKAGYKNYIPSKIGMIFDKFQQGHRNCVVTERSLAYDPSIVRCTGDTYLEGYWQSENYFHDIANIIQDDFSIKTPSDSQNIKWAKKIENNESVCVHVRRGDYITNKETLKKHGVCSSEYYNTAIEYLSTRVPDPHLFVFSDDPEWAREHLEFPYPTDIMSHNNTQKNYEDLRLMTLCKHFIIANSTFSWWGAWLSKNQSKIVITPSKWFQDTRYDDSDLVPREWVRV